MKTRYNLANILTVSRVPLSIAFAIVFPLDTLVSSCLLIAIAILIYITDLSDGWVARRFNPNSTSKAGAALDSMTDSFVLITGLVCLLSKGIIPLWIVLLLLWTRSGMSLVRLVTAVCGYQFAGPRFSTKIMGAAYALGLIFMVTLHTPTNILGFSNLLISVITQLIIWITAISAILASLDFFYTHRSIILSLFTADGNNLIP